MLSLRHRVNIIFLQARDYLFFSLFLSFFLLSSAQAAQVKLLAFGDSLFAGYQLLPEWAYPIRLEAELKKQGFDVHMINASVSGDTVEAGLRRLDWALSDHVDGVLLELGANNMLRGMDVAQTERSLAQIIEKLQSRHIPVVLYGMRADPALGEEYGRRFDALYPRLAQKYHLPLYPFFLDGIALEPALKLKDGMHPNEKGIDLLVERTLPFVHDFLRKLTH